MSDSSDPPRPNAISPDKFRTLLWCVLILGSAVRLYLLFATHATEEDFYITLRYAQNIASGNGFVYNAGAHVLGTTTPLYTLLLALFIKSGLNPILFGKLLGVAADAAAGYFAYRLARSAGRPFAGLLAAILLCFAPVNLTWSVKGMEVELVAAAAAGAWAMWAEKREVAAWCFAGLLMLLRIDGAALAVVMLCATMIGERRVPWRGAAAFVVITLPWLVFAFIYFGSAIPLSLGAKLTVYGRLIPGRFPQLLPFVRLMLHNPIGIALFVGVLAYCGIMALQKRVPAEKSSPSSRELLLVPPLIWICIHYAGMALSHVFLFGWYFVPPTPIYYVVAMVGLSLLAERMLGSEDLISAKSAGVITAALSAVLIAAVVPAVGNTLQHGQQQEEEERIPIGLWLRDHAGSADSVMLEPIGYIGYYSKLKIIDVIGLVSPEALPSYASRVTCPDHDLWQRLRPTWLLLRAGQLKTLMAYERNLPANEQLDSSYTIAKIWRSAASNGELPDFILYRKLNSAVEQYKTGTSYALAGSE